MLLTQLSISFKCSSAIGNSLDMDKMLAEFIKVFLKETNAIYGSFYLNCMIGMPRKIVSFGKDKYFKDEVKNIEYEKMMIVDIENETLKLLIFPLKEGVIYFIYNNQKNIDFEFIGSILKSLKNRLNIAIDSCLNVEYLKLEKIKLERLSNNLQNEVDRAVEENKNKQKQLSEQTKMAQIGEMIGNIAHQWRQPLSIISTAASGMSLKKEANILEDKDFEIYVNEIMNNTTYLSTTLDEFRDYINDSHKTKEVVLQDRLKLSIELIKGSFLVQNIKLIEGKIEKDLIVYRLIPGNLLQVLVSLFNNAKDVLCEKRDKDNRWVKYSLEKIDGNVVISIEDSGGGIDESIASKIFNPYFTTKYKSQGTGIGLYSSYNIIVNQLRGKLFFTNEEFGAKFSIQLPINF